MQQSPSSDSLQTSNYRSSSSVPDSAIGQWMEGQVVLITGVTGFLGKVLVHKLLSSVPRLQKLYLLIRPSRGTSGAKRWKKIEQESFILRELAKEQPTLLDCIEVLDGDVSEPGFGLSEEDMHKIHTTVTVLIHAAATTRFMEPIKQAIAINTLGVKYLIEIARKCEKLISLVHISTAYVNSPLHSMEVDEKIYYNGPSPASVIDRVRALTDEEAEALTPEIIGSYPNTYTFTKTLGEILLEQEARRSAAAWPGDEAEQYKPLPICILRPSIIISSLSEPYPGWVDTLIGPAGLSFAAGLGILHIMAGDGRMITDLVPVDYVCSAIIALSWYNAVSIYSSSTTPNLPKRAHPQLRRLPIYHVTSSSTNPTTWGKMGDICLALFREAHTQSRLALSKHPWQTYVASPFWYSVCHLLFHVTPAFALDIQLYLSGETHRRKLRQKQRAAKAKMVAIGVEGGTKTGEGEGGAEGKMAASEAEDENKRVGKPVRTFGNTQGMRRLDQAVKQLAFFTSHQWWFRSENTIQLFRELSPRDKKIYNFDMATIDWDVVALVYTKGLPRYLAKENLTTAIPIPGISGDLWRTSASL